MVAEIHYLTQDRADTLKAMRALVAEAALADHRELTEQEANQYDSLKAKMGVLDTAIARERDLQEMERQMTPASPAEPMQTTETKIQYPPALTHALDNQGHPQWATFGDQIQAIIQAATGRGIDPRLMDPYAADPYFGTPRAVISGMSEIVDSEGGYLVRSDFSSEVFRRVYAMGNIMSRVRRIPIGANANGYTTFAIDETDRATGSRLGGIQVYWAEEGGSATAKKLKLRKMELKLKKLIGLCYLTDELMQDATALSATVQQGFAEEYTFVTEDSLVNSPGGGKPLGILNSGALVSVSKETGQAAATIVAPNIMKMWTRAWGPGRANSVWFINQEIEPQLWQMSLPVGTGGSALFMPPGGLSTSPYSVLIGRPVIPVEYCAALGTVGDIILADFSQMLFIDKGPMETATSIHVKFTTHEQALRFVYRCDAQSIWNSALTPYKGSATLSPFVALATRS